MEVILIAAMSKNRVIGKGSEIPWHIPGELKRFKEITMGHVLVMGRKTYESIGRALPGRKTVIVTRQREYSAPGCIIAGNLDEALALFSKAEKVFIAGGGEIYRQAVDHADSIYLTTIPRNIEGDTYFPEISAGEFERIFSEEIPGEEQYVFEIYRRRSRLKK